MTTRKQNVRTDGHEAGEPASKIEFRIGGGLDKLGIIKACVWPAGGKYGRPTLQLTLNHVRPDLHHVTLVGKDRLKALIKMLGVVVYDEPEVDDKPTMPQMLWLSCLWRRISKMPIVSDRRAKRTACTTAIVAINRQEWILDSIQALLMEEVADEQALTARIGELLKYRNEWQRIKGNKGYDHPVGDDESCIETEGDDHAEG